MLVQSQSRNSSKRRKFKDPEADEDVVSTALSVDEIFLIVRRQWLIVLTAAILAVGLGAAYVYTATPIYTATVEVVVSGAGESAIADIGGANVEAVKDDDVLTYIELMRSDRIIGRALSTIGPEFDFASAQVTTATELKTEILTLTNLLLSGLGVERVFDTAETGATETDPPLDDAAVIRNIKESVSARRVGRTNVISVSYDDVDPDRAVAIVDAIANSFVEDHSQKRVQNADESRIWLESRISELKQQVLSADTAIQTFRSDNGLLETNGQLVTDQALSQTNELLLVAEAETSKIRAQYERVTDIIASGDTNAVITDALDSSLINQLRGKYLESSKFESEIRSRLGANHEQAIKLRNSMTEYSRLMFEELQRIRDSFANELAVAESREAKLRAAADNASGAAGQSNRVMVQLRELERESEVYRSMYEALLQRLQEVAQQAELPVVVAEVVNRPEFPESPSKPNKALILGLSLLLGIGAGAVGGALRELRDVSYKNGEQLGDDLELRFLGYAPLIKRVVNPRRPDENDQPAAVPPPPPVPTATPKSKRGKTSAVKAVPPPTPRKNVHFIDNTATYVISEPLSQFSETIRGCRLATEREMGKSGSQVIGVISAMPGEGKTTISTNLAMSYAEAGHRTLLIDSDLRRPGLSKLIGRTVQGGLYEVLKGTKTLEEALLGEPEVHLDILPCFGRSSTPADRTLDHRLMGPFLEKLRDTYEYIILDLPPLAPVIDARSISPSLDSFLYVVEWGVTSRSVVRSIVNGEQEIFDKCRGVVLNKTNLDRMKYYAYYGSVEYYRNSYADYSDYSKKS